ncbi:virulence factor Mce family protein [Aeromicrobium marinum DSM 15272]|uniref:Virulence factor Mce family protein n=1 Tax=Aeromicrobium marinum DSM 15272 TaxID=585531 RepID=E2SCR0_9ACTN|nr:MlaD family protein [Aeromicrobium marinum]EFQ83013.1 virulence factor Mce family protein [Aeromicrobium marinum DSM 15272]
MKRLPFRLVAPALALVVVLVLTSVYLYQGFLRGSVTERPAQVTVSLAETGGLFESSGVTYRGVRVGRVDAIRTTDTGVEVVLSIEPGSEVPADSVAVVRLLSPAGEQFLDFQPDDHEPPYFADGDRISADRTSTPVSVAESLRSIEDLMAQIEPEDLRTTLDELSIAFASPDDLGDIIGSSQSVIASLEALWPTTQRVLRNGNTVLATGAELGPDLREFAGSARELGAWLRAYDPNARAIVDEAPAQVEELRALTSTFGLKLPALLAEMLEFTDFTIPYEPHLRQTLSDLPGAFNKFAGTIIDGRIQVSMFVADSVVCSYGVPDRVPTDPTRPEIDGTRGCSPEFERQQRGAAHAPGPLAR